MVKNKQLRIVIDTNLWINFIISKKLNQLDQFFYTSSGTLLFSSELVEELNTVIRKPKLKKYFSDNALEEMLLAFDPFIDFITTKSKVTVCRDPKDDFLLALAKDGTADYLITGDKDLLTLGKFEKTGIVTISEFLKIIAK